ncbi:class F sortase, partial [Marisediminicola senii]|uniref:class F sortase n=1 Tax=Marisediminicola senii TaxID=2711233 RepID=UPI001F2D818D
AGCTGVGAGVDAASTPRSSPTSPAAGTAVPTPPAETPAPDAPAPTAEATPEPAVPVIEPLPVGSPPTAVTIPAMELSEPLIDLGLQQDGTMEVPSDFSEVGWYTGGGKPGGIGPTVIAGHVDSSSGPAVFYRLRELVIGDTVQVNAADGSVVDYTVYRTESFAKAEFPTGDVFGALPVDELRLITCAGRFDTSIGHYDDNLVVYAAPTAR